MDVKTRAVGLCLAIIALAMLAVPPVEAAPKKRPVVYTTQPDPPINRPRARVTVVPRSFLDAGTEVLPGDRKFTDYAFPPAVGYPSFARENLNRPIDRQPLSPPADLGGYPQRIPLY